MTTSLRTLLVPVALLGLAFTSRPLFELSATELAEGVTLLRGGGDGNVLVVAGAGASVLIDSRAPGTAAELIERLAGLELPPLRWLVNTHYHEDHRGANEHFAELGVQLLCSTAARVHMQDDSTIEALGWTLTPAPSAALPALTLDGPGELRVGGSRLTLVPLPAGHTDGDMLVHLLDVDVLHAGDQVEVGAYPFLDVWHGGGLAGLIDGVDVIAARCDDDTVIVPGHGPPVDRRWLADYRAMLADVLARTRAALAEQTSLDAFMDSAPTASWDERFGGGAGGRRFAALAYVGELSAAEAAATER